MSRPSLREALEKLSARGLLETSKAGTFVTKFMKPLTEPLAAMMQSNEQALIDYLEYRCLVEGEAARLAATRATDIELDALRGCLQRMRAAHEVEDPTAEAEADADMHMLIYEASHNLVMLHIMRALSEMLRHGVFYNRHQLYTHPGVRDELLAQHLAIGEAVLARDSGQSGAGRHRPYARHRRDPGGHPPGTGARRPGAAPHGTLRIRRMKATTCLVT